MKYWIVSLSTTDRHRPCTAHVGNHRLPTAAARIRSQITSCGVHGGQGASGQVFSE
jgi:hypothetical protein